MRASAKTKFQLPLVLLVGIVSAVAGDSLGYWVSRRYATHSCQLLRHGPSLAEVGELLRHRSPQTTALYAKVDLAALAPLALAWPGGVR